jgi:PBP4 family serine-type D-alanyl-D-alanine carboxypeptidase
MPSASYATLLNRSKTAAKGAKSTLVIRRELGKNRIVVEGGLALDAKSEERKPAAVTVENPPLYAVWVLRERLRRAGIRVNGDAKTGVKPREGATEIAQHRSAPLSKMLELLNKPSDNLVAECLLKTLGAEKSRQGVGTTAGGIEAALAWFQEIGLDRSGIDMVDGSGLSRQNFVSPRNLARLLETMYGHPHAQVFLDSLPLAGVDGTLRNRMRGTPAEKNCRAKSGYVSSMSSLSGYVTTQDGEPLLFVILMNNHKARNSVATGVQNKIVVLLASWQKKNKLSGMKSQYNP